MKDLDFDELDKAVNSLIKKTTNTDEYEKDEEVLDVPDSGNFQKPNIESQPSEVPQNIQSEVEKPVIPGTPKTTLVGRRSSGQFMDVVHPSSDMRRAPLSVPDRKPKVENEVPTTDTAVNNTNNPIETEKVVETTDKNTDWPDPINYQKNQAESVSLSDSDTKVPKSEDEDIDKIADEINEELDVENKSSQESPFLSDAKVEKRPLGAFSDNQIEKEDTTLEQNNNDTEIAEIKPADKSDNDPNLPAELQDELLHIESDESKDIKPELKEVALKESFKNTDPDTTSNEPTSINQQYKEQPSSGDRDSGAIYDTDSYHKPVIRPVKKKSGWLWVLWIVLLLVLGAGAGAAIYFLKIL